MEEYSSNSKKSKTTAEKQSKEAPKATKVIKGDVKMQKKSEMSKLFSSFLAEDIQDVKSYVIFDVLMPTIKNGLMDSLGMLLGVDVRYSRNRDRNRVNRDRASYGRYYDSYDDRRDSRRDNRREDDDRSRSRIGLEYEDAILDDRGEVESVFSTMEEFIDIYGQVRVADLCSMIGISSPYTGNDYGWTSMRGMDFETVRGGGYRLRLPRPSALSERR